MMGLIELRERFESWAKEENLSLKKGRLDYEFEETYTAWRAWRAALAAAPTPPVCQTCNGNGEIGGFVNTDSGYENEPCPECATQTPPAVEPIKPIGHICQYTYENLELHGLIGWHDCPDNDLKYYADRGEKTRTLYMYVDQPTLHTSPPSPADSKLRKAAEEAVRVLDKFADRFENLADTRDNLRAAMSAIPDTKGE